MQASENEESSASSCLNVATALMLRARLFVNSLKTGDHNERCLQKSFAIGPQLYCHLTQLHS